MRQAGQICLFRFPQTDLETGKPRPALLVARLPGLFDDWRDISDDIAHVNPIFCKLVITMSGYPDLASSNQLEIL